MVCHGVSNIWRAHLGTLASLSRRSGFVLAIGSLLAGARVVGPLARLALVRGARGVLARALLLDGRLGRRAGARVSGSTTSISVSGVSTTTGGSTGASSASPRCGGRELDESLAHCLRRFLRGGNRPTCEGGLAARGQRVDGGCGDRRGSRRCAGRLLRLEQGDVGERRKVASSVTGAAASSTLARDRPCSARRRRCRM